MAQPKSYKVFEYISISRCTGNPIKRWVADSTCTDGGSNVNWTFVTTVDYVTVTDSRVSPYDTWFLGLHSTDGGRNVGWGFTPIGVWGYFTWK